MEDEAFRVRLHAPVPLQDPDHPEKVSFGPSVSVRVTCVFSGKLVVHVEGQFMPAGLLVTVPVPETDTVSVDVDCPGGGVAVMVVPFVPLPQDTVRIKPARQRKA